MDKAKVAEVLQSLRSGRGAGSVSWPTRMTVLALILMHVTTYIPGGYDAMALAPGKVGPPRMHIWALLTASFMEKSIIQLLLDVFAVIFCARVLEPLWGGAKLLEMMVVVGIAANLVTVLAYIGLYAASFNPDLLFLPFSGFSAVVCGLAVAYKQSFPQATIHLGPLHVHTRFAPLALIAAHAIFLALGTGSLAQLLLCSAGFITAWVFLRFYQTRNGVKGDPSDAFGFESFFPSPMQPVIKAVGARVFRALQVMNVCPRQPGATGVGDRFAYPGQNTDIHASRWRSKAMRDLDSQLKQSAPTHALTSVTVTPDPTRAQGGGGRAAADGRGAKDEGDGRSQGGRATGAQSPSSSS